MFEHKRIQYLFLLIIALGTVSYVAGLSIDVTRDAGKYATIAKEIYQNGNFINLTIHGDPYDQKPPMLFWLGAIGFKIGTVNNFWFKLPVLLLIFAGIYWAFQLGKSLYNCRVGLITATMMAFSFIYVMYSSDIHTDTVMQAFVILALWQLSEFIKTKKNINWILGFTGIGLAMLSKGPVGAAIPAFAVVGHLILNKDYKSLLNYRWYLGVLLALIVTTPALIGLMNQFGWKGIQFFFWENNVGRITGSYVSNNNDPVFYVHNLAYLFLPWSILFFISAFLEIRSLIRNRFRSKEYFTFTGIWIYFIIINSASSQLPNYVFGIVPLVAVLTAKWIDRALEQERLYKLFDNTQKIVVSLLWGGILALVVYFFPNAEWYHWAYILAGLAACLYFWLKIKERSARLLIPSLVVFTGLSLTMNTHIFPYMFSYQAPPQAARYFNELDDPSTKLYNYKYGQFELFFYSNPQATQLKTEEELRQAVSNKGSWIFTDPEGLADIEKLKVDPDTVIEYQHLYLNRGGRFINPKTRDQVLQPMYLLKYAN